MVSEIRVALVCPTDVSAEVEVARETVALMNNMIEYTGERISLWHWERDLIPALHPGGAQGLTDSHMKPEELDLVIGVFWSRLGTPVFGSDSGTVHELELAWQGWRSRGRPDVLLFFSHAKVDPQLPEAALLEMARLAAFRRRVPAEQSVKDFESLDEFRDQLSRALGTWIGTRRVARRKPVTNGLFAIPELLDSIPRLRVNQRLGQLIESSSVVVVEGLSGVGKTHVVANLVKDRYSASTCLWYDMPSAGTLDELLSSLPPEWLSATLSLESRCKQLVSQLRMDGTVLVIDNVERGDPGTLRPLLEVAGRAGAPATVILISPAFQDLPGVRHFFVRGLARVDTEKLLLRRDIHLSEYLLDQLMEKTEGLGLAVDLFATLITVLGHDPAELLTNVLMDQQIVEDWFQRIVSALSSGQNDLLTLLSLAETGFSDEVVKAGLNLVPKSDRPSAFEALRRLYLVQRHRGTQWRVHQFVAMQLERRLSEGRRRKLCAALARVHLAHVPRAAGGKWSRASFARALRACRDLQRAGRFIDSAALLQRMAAAAKKYGHYESFAALADDQLKLNPVAADPWLVYHLAHCLLIIGEAGRAAVLVKDALHSDLDENTSLALVRLLAEALIETGANAEAEARLAAALDRSGRSAKRTTVSHARSTLARLLTLNGKLVDAMTLAERNLVESHKVDDPLAGAIALTHIGRLHRMLGDLGGAERNLVRALELFRDTRNERGVGWTNEELSRLKLQQRNRAAAGRCVAEALRIRSAAGENTVEYREYLQDMRAALVDDPGLTRQLEQELLRVG